MKINQAIKNYDKAIWDLAKVMCEVRAKHSRNALLELTPFNKTKIELFLKLGELAKLNYPNLIPEHYMEVLKETKDNQNKFLEQASKEGLKPLQLRKLIRRANKTVSSKDKDVAVNSWHKHLIMLDNSLKNMPADVKARALNHISESLLK